ncbi:MAG: PEGA domain-containing protein [Deltaproteobacteria bacterium]|nr:PEGA domain-containing protein [Deltaproteobacteria bacterium]
MKRPVLFGKYVLLERISVGGMAEVFQAKSFGVEGFEKILAIKRILPSLAEDDEFIDMFIDEAKIAGQLSHANVCQIFELGEIAASHFIAMEYVWGKDCLQVQNRFRRLRRRMPLPMACYIAGKTCEGLDYAHRKRDDQGSPLNIIHRDVSPQNVLISYEGEIKIIDFGIAKAVSRSSKTQAGVLKGKFGYMSPEQVRGLPLDQRSDIFAIGTILYEMCTGERLFTGESDFATLEKVRNADVLPPSTVNPMIPAELDAIVLKALQREPEDRYTWANDMQEDLMAFLMHQEPIFTAKHLSATLKELFEKERRREQESLEAYKRIRREDVGELAVLAPGGGAALPLVPTLPPTLPPLSADADSPPAILTGRPREPSRPGAREPSRPGPREPSRPGPREPSRPSVRDLARPVLPVAVQAPDTAEQDDFDEGATEVGGPGFAREVSPSLAAGAAGLVEEPSGELPEVKEFDDGATQIFADQAAPKPFAAEPTYIFNADAAQAPPPGASAKPGSGNGRLQPSSTGSAAVIFDAVPNAGPDSGMQPISGTTPLALGGRRATLVKDVLIGVLVALVVILCLVLWRFFSVGPKEAPATVVISTSPPRAAEIHLDGRSVGRMSVGTPFTLKDLASGTHQVTVLAEGGAPVVNSVTVKPGDVRVLLVTLPTPKAAGYLLLELDPKDAQVWVDGAEISAAAVRSPIQLAADRPHELKVAKTGYEPEAFTVQVKGAERQERKVTLHESAVGRALIQSEPPGALVALDSKARGTTPLTLSELAPGRYKVSFSLEGYEGRTAGLTVQAGKQAEVKVQLVARSVASGEDDGSAAVRPTPPPRKPKRSKTHERTGGSERDPGTKPEGGETGTASVAGQGFLVANTTPWAKVLIDGQDTGRTTPIAPRSKIPLKAGKHTVTFVVEGKRFSFPLSVKAGETARLIKQLPVEP